MKKVILAGASLNSGNNGVNALTRSQIMFILDHYGVDVEIIILSYTVKETLNNKIQYNGKDITIKEIPCNAKKLIEAYVKSIFIGKNYILDLIKSADAVWDISEGDSFSDIYGSKRFIQHSLIKLTAINVKTKLVLMPQTLGPFNKSWVKWVARRILNKADYVFVRDEISKNIAIKDLRVTNEIMYIPDMAFYMKAANNISIEKFIPDNDKIKVGINISALLYNGGYNRNNMFNLKCNYKELVEKLIQFFATLDNVKVILVPHVMTKEFEVEDDFRVCKDLADLITKRIGVEVKTIDHYYKEDEIKAIISGCDFFVGSRMHACIGAISTFVPTVPIAYSRKFVGIWEKLGLENCITDPRKQSEDEIISHIKEIFNERLKVKEVLKYQIPLLKEQIKRITDIIE